MHNMCRTTASYYFSLNLISLCVIEENTALKPFLKETNIHIELDTIISVPSFDVLLQRVLSPFSLNLCTKSVLYWECCNDLVQLKVTLSIYQFLESCQEYC